MRKGVNTDQQHRITAQPRAPAEPRASNENVHRQDTFSAESLPSLRTSVGTRAASRGRSEAAFHTGRGRFNDTPPPTAPLPNTLPSEQHFARFIYFLPVALCSTGLAHCAATAGVLAISCSSSANNGPLLVLSPLVLTAWEKAAERL